MTPEQLEKELRKIRKMICCNTSSTVFVDGITITGDGSEGDPLVSVGSSGVADGDKGDITVATSGTVWTIDNDVVTYAKMQNVSATSRFLGRITAGAGNTEELTGTQATTLLDIFTSTLKGLVPLSGGGTTNFLRADGSWAAPAGGMTNPLTTTGDIIYSSSGSTPARLGIGTAGQVLFVDGTGVPIWDDINLVVLPSGSGEEILYDDGSILYHKTVVDSTFIDASTTVTDEIQLSLSATGTPSSSTFLRGDNTWASPASSTFVGLTDGPGTFTGNSLKVVRVNAGETALEYVTLAGGGDMLLGTAQTVTAAKTYNVNTLLLAGSTSGTITLNATAVAGTNTITLPAATGTVALLNTSQTWTADQIYTSGTIRAQGGIQTNSVSTTSNFAVSSANGTTSLTAAQFLFAGASTVNARVFLRGSANSTLSANANYGGFLIGEQAVTEATSGTHPLMSALVVKPAVITGAGGDTTDLATVYIEGPMTGVTPTNLSSSLWIGSGNVLLGNGSLTLNTAGNKINIATGSDASIGTATLSGGTITVSTTAVTANSKIFLTVGVAGGTQGNLSVGTVTAGTSFVINSTSGTETSDVNWLIIN